MSRVDRSRGSAYSRPLVRTRHHFLYDHLHINPTNNHISHHDLRTSRATGRDGGHCSAPTAETSDGIRRNPLAKIDQQEEHEGCDRGFDGGDEPELIQVRCPEFGIWFDRLHHSDAPPPTSKPGTKRAQLRQHRKQSSVKPPHWSIEATLQEQQQFRRFEQQRVRDGRDGDRHHPASPGRLSTGR